MTRFLPEFFRAAGDRMKVAGLPAVVLGKQTTPSLPKAVSTPKLQPPQTLPEPRAASGLAPTTPPRVTEPQTDTMTQVLGRTSVTAAQSPISPRYVP